MAAVDAARAGDVVIIPPGFYSELVLLEKPLRLVGELTEDLQGSLCKAVVLQSARSTAVTANARRGPPEPSVISSSV
jgi:hypothetical protein